MKKTILFIIKLYRHFISGVLVTLFGHGCRFRPTCSQYATEAIGKYGVLKGSGMTIKRILKCNPWQ